jgi:hypothetical protein
MERGHPVSQRAEPAQLYGKIFLEFSRWALRRTGCPRSVKTPSLLRAVLIRWRFAKVVAQQHPHRYRYTVAHGREEVHLSDGLHD